MNMDDFIDLDALNKMIEEDNIEAAKRAELEREREKKEEEELKAAKAKSLRVAKEEKKHRKVDLRTKFRQEGTSTSRAPHSSSPQDQPLPAMPQETQEKEQPMTVQEEEKVHREGKAPLVEEKEKPAPAP